MIGALDELWAQGVVAVHIGIAFEPLQAVHFLRQEAEVGPHTVPVRVVGVVEGVSESEGGGGRQRHIHICTYIRTVR